MYISYEDSVPTKASIDSLKTLRSRKLHKVGYVDNYENSVKNIMCSDNHFIQVTNDVFPFQNALYAEELSRLAFCNVKEPKDDIAYEITEGDIEAMRPYWNDVQPGPVFYSYKEYGKIICDIRLVIDHYDYINLNTDVRHIADSCQIAILHFIDGSSMLIATGSPIGEFIQIYDDTGILDSYLHFSHLHGIDPNDGESNLKILDNRRAIIPIDEYDPDKYTAE